MIEARSTIAPAPFCSITRAAVELPLSDWDKVVAVNLTGVFLCSQAAAGRRLSAFGDNRIELAPDPQAGKRGVGDQRQTFAGKVVDDGEDPEPPAVAPLIMQEIQRPALVWALR